MLRIYEDVIYWCNVSIAGRFLFIIMNELPDVQTRFVQSSNHKSSVDILKAKKRQSFHPQVVVDALIDEGNEEGLRE